MPGAAPARCHAPHPPGVDLDAAPGSPFFPADPQNSDASLAPDPAEAELRPRLESLDDPVQIYLRDVRRMPALTHAAEVAIFQRIEAAEAGLWETSYALGFAAKEHIRLAEQLLAEAPEARFERIVLEEHHHARVDYRRQLAALVITVRGLDQAADQEYAAFQRASISAERELALARYERAEAELRQLLPGFAFKPAVAEEMAVAAEALRQEFLLSLHGLIVAEVTRPRLPAGAPGSPSPREAYQRLEVLQGLARMPAAEYFRVCSRLKVHATEADRGRHEIVVANLRLVVHVAKRYANGGLPLLDLIQEGNVGLMKTVEKFDFRRGFRFATFAMWGIREAVSRSLANQARLIRLPVHMHASASRLMAAQKRLLQDLGREPTAEEIADDMHLPVDRVRAGFRAVQPLVSLHSPASDDSDACIGDLIEDLSQGTPGEAASLHQVQHLLAEALASLTPREREVLEMRFGLGGAAPVTLEEAGQHLGVTRERVRQIESNALRKLRHPSRSRKLRTTEESPREREDSLANGSLGVTPEYRLPRAGRQPRSRRPGAGSCPSGPWSNRA